MRAVVQTLMRTAYCGGVLLALVIVPQMISLAAGAPVTF